MARAECDVVSAEDDFGGGLQGADVLCDFFDAGVPVCHHRLHEDEIERSFFFEKGLEEVPWQAESAEMAGDCLEAGWRGNSLFGESTSPPAVGFESVGGGERRGKAVEVVKEDKVCFASQIAGDAEQAVWF